MVSAELDEMRKIRGKIRLPREHREVRCTKGRSDRRDRPGVQLGCQHEAQRMIHGPNTFRRCRLFEKNAPADSAESPEALRCVFRG